MADSTNTELAGNCQARDPVTSNYAFFFFSFFFLDSETSGGFLFRITLFLPILMAHVLFFFLTRVFGGGGSVKSSVFF